MKHLIFGLIFALGLAGQAGAVPAGSSPPGLYGSQVPALTEAGIPTPLPFVLDCKGQSNAVGNDAQGNLSMIASQAGNVLTVTQVTTGNITLAGSAAGQSVGWGSVLSGSSVPTGETVLTQASGDPLGIGTYIVSGSATIASGETITAPKATSHDIFATNAIGDQNQPTAIVPALFGQLPFNIEPASAGTDVATTNPLLVKNNQCVQAANYFRSYFDSVGQTKRPIVLLLDAFPGLSVYNWLPSPPVYDMWGVMTSAISVITTQYGAGWIINDVIWDQGEADSSITEAVYATAFQQLVTRETSLAQWSNDSRWTNVELGQWNEEGTSGARNDFIRTTADGNLYPWMTSTPSLGMSDSLTDFPVHFDGESLVRIGQRDFSAWRRGMLRTGYAGRVSAQGASESFSSSFSVSTGNTLLLGIQDILSGANITATGGTITLPAASVSAGAPPIIIDTEATTTLTAPGPMVLVNSAVQNTSITLPTNRVFEVHCVNALWRIEAVYNATGGFDYSPPSLHSDGAAFTIGSWQNLGRTWYSLTTNAVTLPAAAVGTHSWFFNIPTATGSSSLAVPSDTITGPDGVEYSSYPIPKGTIVELASNTKSGSSTHYFVLYDSSRITRQTLTLAAAGTQVAAAGVAVQTISFGVSGTGGALATVSVALPTSPRDGDTINLVGLQAVTALSFTGGTLASSVPTTLTAGQKTYVVYSSTLAKWL